MKKTAFVIILVLKLAYAFSQKNNINWFFGDSALITFTDAGIVATKVPGYAYEASVSYSDSEGNLLFYSDGSKIYDTSKTIMSNSYLDIDQYISGSGSSICQGSIVIPKPASDHEYYIINKVEEGLKYSKLDMLLNGGLGDIVIDAKNIWIFDAGAEGKYVSQKMTATKHGNGKDWWVLFHGRSASFSGDSINTFYKLLVTDEGIAGPYEQEIGLKIENIYVGQMVFSPDGSKLAYTGNYSLEVFDFDRCTGELIEYKKVDTINGPSFSPYGCAFSSDSKKIYVSEIYNFGNDKIYQYDLSSEDDLSETKTLIYKCQVDNYGIGQMLLGSDNRIYFTIIYYNLPSAEYTLWNMNLSVINNPNEAGLACDVDTATVWLGGARSITGLPNMPNYNLGALAGSPCDTITALQEAENKNSIDVYPNPAKNYFYITTNLTETVYYTLQNSLGQTISEGSFSQNTMLPAQNLTCGIYFLQVKNVEGQCIKTEKIVKH
ncbi:MAG: T9SS type A sorting domain-containing protein [Chitinophagales bacterium]